MSKDIQEIPIEDITVAPELQIRARLNPGVVRNYREQLTAGTKFPPVTVFSIEGKLFLIDGHHRREAHLSAGSTTITAIVQAGDLASGFAAAVQANTTHGTVGP